MTTAHFAIAEEYAYNGAGYTFTQYKIATGEVIDESSTVCSIW
jgi:hypothetical protein